MGKAFWGDRSTRGEGNEQDILIELLSHPYRQFILQDLVDADGPETVNEVALSLGAWQADLPVADRSATGIDAIESVLHHHHLPKMAAADVVEYEPTRGTVTPTARATALTSYLNELENHQRQPDMTGPPNDSRAN